MKKLKLKIREYFTLTEKEVNGFILLSFIILLVMIFPWIYNYYLQQKTDELTLEESTFLTPVEKSHYYSNSTLGDSAAASNVVTPFDPNLLQTGNWEELGLSSTIARRIEKYKAKGGQFKTKTDLLKIYGFPKDIFFSLHSFILLPDSVSTNFVKFSASKSFVKNSPFDLNKANKQQLEEVNGIGPILAERIIKFRDGLGGFVKKEQIYEVYGLDSLTAVKVFDVTTIAKDFKPHTISINNATYSQLCSNPYIGKKGAALILKYKSEHGPFKSEEDLDQALANDKGKREKIKPYITF